MIPGRIRELLKVVPPHVKLYEQMQDTELDAPVSRTSPVELSHPR